MSAPGRMLLRNTGFTRNRNPFLHSDGARGVPVSGLTMESARPILRTVNENVLLEIQKTFDFFRSTTQSDRIDRVVVSGGASRVEGFTDMLAERFDVDVEAFDPFKTISFEPAKFGVDSAADVAATSAVAVVSSAAVSPVVVSSVASGVFGATGAAVGAEGGGVGVGSCGEDVDAGVSVTGSPLPRW